MQRLKAVLFDLDETLTFLNMSVLQERLTHVYQTLVSEGDGLTVEKLEAEHRRISQMIWAGAEGGVIRTPEGALDGLAVMRHVWREALVACGCEDARLADRASDLFWQNRLGIVGAFDDVAPVLRKLRGDFQMAVITNGPAITQLDKLQVLGLDSYFDARSRHLPGFGTPASAEVMNDLALDKLGIAPAEAIHVGDSLTSDVAGAKAAGIRAVWLNRHATRRPPDAPQPDYEIASLLELTAIIDNEPP